MSGDFKVVIYYFGFSFGHIYIFILFMLSLIRMISLLTW